MTTPRFFVPGPWEGTTVALPEKASRHAMIVLRLRAGDRAEIFDGKGRAAAGTLQFSKEGTVIEHLAPLARETESPLKMTLAQAFVSPEKLDWIVEKAVEIGAARIVFFPAARSVTKLTGEKLEKRVAKLRAAAAAACEQCGRSLIPSVDPYPDLASALASIEAERRFILAPAARGAFAVKGAASAAFAVGPEGGFDEKEIEAAKEAGWEATLLGPRVLRTETAGLAAMAAANALAGDYL